MMLVDKGFVLFFSVLQTAAIHDVRRCDIDNTNVSDPMSIYRYLQCENNTWVSKLCPPGEVYQDYIYECIPAEFSMFPPDYEVKILEDSNNVSKAIEMVNVTDEYTPNTEEPLTDGKSFEGVQVPSEKSAKLGDIDVEPKTLQETLIAAANKSANKYSVAENTILVNNGPMNNITNEEARQREEPVSKDFSQTITDNPLFAVDGPITSSELPVVRKSIADDSSGIMDQELTEKRLYVPNLNKKTMKTKANWTTSVLNGVAVYTDISYYQSHGKSYEFRVPGGLPAEQNQVIAWIRENSHKYLQTEIPYGEEDEKDQELDVFPIGLPSRCGTKFLDKLSGGNATPIENNPWQVAVLRRADNAYVCGGAVITRRHVISAAHCFRQKNKRYTLNDIILRVGDYDKEVREESQVDYSVILMLIHEDFTEKKHIHDIAVLCTSDYIPFSSHIYPICLPSSNVDYTPGQKCTVSGWGQVEAEDVPTRYLRSGEVTIISKAECRRKTIFSRGVPVEVFCAEDPTKKGVDTCLGDSGGPFACNDNGVFFLYGITAFGSYPCGQDIPSFYTNVSHYREWILQQINKTD